MAINPKPQAHPTKWTLVVTGPLPAGSSAERIRELEVQAVYDYDTQAEAEAELAKAIKAGSRGYVLPPVKAWGGQPAPAREPSRDRILAMTKAKEMAAEAILDTKKRGSQSPAKNDESIDESVAAAIRARSDLSAEEIKTLIDLVRAEARRDLLAAAELLLEHVERPTDAHTLAGSVSDLEHELTLTVDYSDRERIKRDIARAKVVDQARAAIAKAKGRS